MATKKTRGTVAGEHGFTAIEFVVVVLILGILVAITLPTLSGARKRVQDRQAKATLMTALDVARLHYARSGSYVGFGARAGESIEPALTWGDRPDSAAPGTVYVVEAEGSDVHLVARSESGRYFALHGRAEGVTTYCSDGSFQLVDSEAECVQASW